MHPGRVTAKLSRDGYANAPLSIPHTAPVRELVPALIIVVAQRLGQTICVVRGVDSPTLLYYLPPPKGGVVK